MNCIEIWKGKAYICVCFPSPENFFFNTSVKMGKKIQQVK